MANDYPDTIYCPDRLCNKVVTYDSQGCLMLNLTNCNFCLATCEVYFDIEEKFCTTYLCHSQPNPKDGAILGLSSIKLYCCYNHTVFPINSFFPSYSWFTAHLTPWFELMEMYPIPHLFISTTTTTRNSHPTMSSSATSRRNARPRSPTSTACSSPPSRPPPTPPASPAGCSPPTVST